MSFKGRYQKLCPNGHYVEECVYMESDKCEECGEKWVKKNLVDDTNDLGEGYDYGMVPVPKPKELPLRQSFALYLADFKASRER